MNSYEVTEVRRHRNGRCEVYMMVDGEQVCYGVAPGSRDKSPMHQELEGRISAGEFDAITKAFVPALPGAAPSANPDHIKLTLTQQVERDYAAQKQRLIDPETVLLLEEARLWLTESSDDEAPNPDPEDYPLLGAIAQAGDLNRAASDIVIQARENKAHLARLLKTRATSIALINAAQTVDDAEAHFAAIDWGA